MGLPIRNGMPEGKWHIAEVEAPCKSAKNSIDNGMIKQPAADNTVSRAPVQVISVPINHLRAEPSFRSSDACDVEESAANRFGALSLQDGENDQLPSAKKASQIVGGAARAQSPPFKAASPDDASSPSHKYAAAAATNYRSATSPVPTTSRPHNSPAADMPPPPNQKQRQPQRQLSGADGSGDSVSSSLSVRSQREQFLIFIKILFKWIKFGISHHFVYGQIICSCSTHTHLLWK